MFSEITELLTEEILQGVIDAGIFEKSIPVEDLVIDFVYQAECRPKLKGPFDPHAFGVPTIALRKDGTMCVIDGQRRIGLAKRSGITHVQGLIIDSPNVEFEAALFIKLNCHIKNKPNAILKSNIAAKHPDALLLKKIIEEAGFELNLHASTSSWPNIAAIKPLEIMFKRSPQHLRYVLELLKEFWHGDDRALYGNFLRGFSSFVWKCYQQPAWTHAGVKKKISCLTPCKDKRESILTYDLIEAYNKGRSVNRLSH